MPVFGVCRETAKNTPVSARAFVGISTRPKTQKRRHGADFAPTRHCTNNPTPKVLSAVEALRPSGEVMTVFRVPTNA